MFTIKHETNIGLILAKGLQDWLNINSQSLVHVFVSHVSQHLKLSGVYANAFLTGYINIHAIYLFHTIIQASSCNSFLQPDSIEIERNRYCLI